LQAVQSCNERLNLYLTQCDWEKAQAEVTKRDHLLRQSSNELARLRKAGRDGLDEGELAHARQVLKEVRRSGQAFVEMLKTHRRELNDRIKSAKQGRAALNLYHTPRPGASAKFVDRKG
jgi:hypothetical protein